MYKKWVKIFHVLQDDTVRLHVQFNSIFFKEFQWSWFYIAVLFSLQFTEEIWISFWRQIRSCQNPPTARNLKFLSHYKRMFVIRNGKRKLPNAPEEKPSTEFFHLRANGSPIATRCVQVGLFLTVCLYVYLYLWKYWFCHFNPFLYQIFALLLQIQPCASFLNPRFW